jgi:cob(I)alamin adenosyltransferase
VIVVTGTGKGKSTSAFGMLMRSWARGYRCGVFQFVKSGKWKVGEAKAAAALGGIDWEKMGDGWSWLSKDLDESADMAREGWGEVQRAIAQERYEFLLLDEITYPIKWGWIDVHEVVATLRDRPASSTSWSPGATRARADRAGRPRLRGRQGQAPDGRGDPSPAGDRVVDVLLILDGASEPLGPAPTSLERARTPALDALAREGALSRLRTIAPGLPAGSEAAIPALLGWMPPAPVDRGALEAAARGIELGAGQRAWRVDVLGSDGRRGADGETVRAATSLASGLRRTPCAASAGTGCWSPAHRRCPRRRGPRASACGPPASCRRGSSTTASSSSRRRAPRPAVPACWARAW